MRQKLFLAGFLAILAGAAIVPALATSDTDTTTDSGGFKDNVEALNKEIEARKQKIKEIEASIETYKKKISEKRLESVSLSNQLSIIDNRRAQIELDIEATRTRIETINLEIEKLSLAIAEKERIIEREQEMLSEFIRVLHLENGKNYIEILAAYDQFSDFYGRIQQLQKIEQDLGRQAKSLRLAKADQEAKREEAEEKKSTFEELSELLQQKQKDLEEQAFNKQTVLAQTQASELTYKTLVDNLRAQYQAIENEVSSIERQIQQKLAEQDAFSNISDDSTLLSWPTQSRYITAYFHDPSYPYRQVFEHNAIDIRAAQGTPLKAAASGYVARAKRCTVASCYSYVLIVHQNGLSTLYGHVSGITVTEDQFVARGDLIGYSGAAPGTVGAGPFTTGPHLHFEVRKGGIPVNPLNYLIKDY